ncbi:amino acid/amide ABC transporter ATP-binding protein 1 (HAAT family) [Salinibacterium amurskyense]|uniref:Amino acid/amide ABC transporter ATP-binding protein 1 (HAAT family) n=1 Tax=Salinibacterium amurskyense TaxID=205941 RepID=A0A2M9D1L2_9MICO|nr:ABC transporter ATP-binding protein [Salinibacterium amurskyense]PJJ78094.1 amino acid/amide ABC transporter ATP-binding protein 1 (HAAT family) [Salinibacterium amurskyense]RLQ80246.1 ABC transporter ATP-binding protein [Salinibacterium amurskyense]GHD82521.1 ABC transporter ATP-binding protein [Salinibacterium amurskyense]
MSNQPVLTVEHLALTIGGAVIIDDVSLSIAQGEMLGVIGPNGAGKTTLFNLISGVMTPTGGVVTLEGRDVTNQSIDARARAGLGRTFQTSSLFPALSALENVRLAAQVKLGGATSVIHFPRAHDKATTIARARLDEVGLSHHSETEAGVLSHGDKRKLEIAMLLATDPSVILLDEPMAGVASGDVAGLTEVIRQVHQSGRTVLMVEHHMDVVLGLVDRVAVMHHGQLLACDTPDAVMADEAVQKAYLGAPL